MRTIEFRGQRKDIGEWIYGSLIYSKESYYIQESGEGGNFIYPMSAEVIPETVGQFTGLVDKNGKEAYEGDTIKSHYANAVKSEHTETIVFYSGSFRAECKIGETGRSLSLLADGIPHLSQDKSVYMEYFEIIGNIHERSEV